MQFWSTGVRIMLLSACAFFGVVISDLPGQDITLPGTAPLIWRGDIASRLIDSCDRFLLTEIERSIPNRAQFWHRNTSSYQAYNASIQENRSRFAKMIGIQDERLPFEEPEMLGLVGEGPNYKIHSVRWPVTRYVNGYGLLVIPNQQTTNRAAIVVPDADQWPTHLLGLTGDLPLNMQMARALAEQGIRVLIPAVINRKAPNNEITNRERIYRSAYPLGRHLIGFEVQKILAGIDWLINSGAGEIMVCGWGEGGLLSLYASAVDVRISEARIAGYFGSRQEIWKEPASRNVFGLLREFGDAEIASMIAPRKLSIYSDLPGPQVPSLPGLKGKPGRLITPNANDVALEIDRAHQLTRGLDWRVKMIPTEVPTKLTPTSIRLPDSERYHQQMMIELDQQIQWLLRESPYVRKGFLQDLSFNSIEDYQLSTEKYRRYFANEVIGIFDKDLLPFNVRSRRLDVANNQVSAYEVVLDVFPGIFAYGILLMPSDLISGEKRPAVVCQHGLEGRPQSTIGEQDFKAYKAFAMRLAERGYIVFAPQNLYIFEDRFRTLQFKANAIKKTLFSIMVPQHEQITNWLAGLEAVDERHIAFYGLSYGGKSAMRIPPLVDKYCLSICSADFNDWVWKVASSRSPYSYVNTGEYEIFEWDLGSTFNYSEMAALIAPRPFMVERGHFDGVAPDERVAYEYAKVRHLYNAKLNIGDRTEIEWFVGPHTINGVGTFDFLDRHLNFKTAK